MKGLHQLIVRSHVRLRRGRVWCHACGRTTHVDPVGAMRFGWPKCCGATMSIDSPEERRELAELEEHHCHLEKLN